MILYPAPGAGYSRLSQGKPAFSASAATALTPVPGQPQSKTACPDPICVSHPDSKSAPLPGLTLAATYLLSGALLHKLPPRLPKDNLKTLLPSDWKVWTRVILGIAALQKINQVLGWKPPPWLGALEAIAIVNPLATGIRAENLVQMGLMAPIVAAVVEGASVLQKKIAPPLQKRYDTPPVIVRLGVSLILGVASLVLYPVLYGRIARSGILGKDLKEKAMESGSAFASAAFATCARGCSPGSFICLGELADVVGSFGNWDNSKPDASDTAPSTASRPLKR